MSVGFTRAVSDVMLCSNLDTDPGQPHYKHIWKSHYKQLSGLVLKDSLMHGIHVYVREL